MKSSQGEKIPQTKGEIVEIHSSGSETTESLCSLCERELSKAAEDKEERNNEDPEDILDDLLEASRSLSQISVQDDEIDFEIDQETLFDLENAAKLSENKDSRGSSEELVTPDQIKEYSLGNHNGLGDLRVEDLSSDESDFFLRISSLRQDALPQQPGGWTAPGEPQVSKDDGEPAQKRVKLTGGVSSGKSQEADGNLDDWGTDFPPEVELQKIDDSVRALTQQNLEGPLEKSEEEPFKLSEIDYKGITEKLISRKREFQDLIDNVYEASCYLGRIKEILAAAPASGPVVIPPPPKPSGYDQQFDFPDRSRFPKLPITIESCGGSRGHEFRENSFPKPQLNALSNPGKSGKSAPRKGFINSVTALKPSSAKSINNRIEIALPNRFKKQQTIKDMFSTGNKENKKGSGGSGETNKSFEKDTISDSGSMYNFNPLVRARKPAK
ncbi:uncharacterized protein LOC107036382 [Diachasma alloeum]|uniref:uncharacterized protein LOC107036382 n=1 Tax=Diachasma alloeum TaxID=454923 RepID=UPI0007382608|nr:uncharacterized protein LOC107036382 [Diachasma alloeum]